MDTLPHSVAVGVLATAMMDLWGFARRPLLGFPRADYRLIGRWVGHMPRGRFRHEDIKRSPRVPGEHLIGWCVHYAIGTGFALLLVAVAGPGWLHRPTLAPAVLVGLVTVAAPLFVMQPAMGAGIAGSRAPNPASARVQSLITHLVYGVGLFLAAWSLHHLTLS